ncbi:MAG TPA: efflux RND transporter permease subunit, partial [Candidatus Absconditabacterales bacterium]|nr:efflux RND transporter permease subunit [Candidatus Absconditabacterales bacterium]
MSLSSYSASLENGFFGRWIKNFRISLMLTILLIGYGLYAAIQIPKESSPEITFGLVSVNTVYPGTNPIDMDELITTKLEDTIDDLDGIDKIESTSSVGISSIVITLKNETNTKDFLNELKTTIDKVILPDDAKDPIVTEISTANEVLFELMLYGSADHFTMNHIRSLGYHLADRLKGKGPIIDAQIGTISRGGGGQASSSDDQFDVQVLVDEKKMQQLGLTLGQVTQAIRAFNTNLPLGNHELGELNYDYRIKGKLSSFDDLMNVPLSLGGRGPIEYIRLSDIALVQRNYKDQSIGYGGSYNHSNNLGVKVVIYKEKRSNIFADAGQAKTLIANELQKPLYKGVNVDYTTDLSEVIIDDYKSLAGN